MPSSSARRFIHRALFAKANPFVMMAGIAATSLGGALAAAWYVSSRVTPFRKRNFLDAYTFTPWELGVPFETITLQSSDGLRLSAWWMGHPQAKGTIIACHGHTGRKDDCLGIGTGCWRAGYNVLLFDFRGRGDSDAWPNSLVSREVEDLLAAVAFARAKAPEQRLGVIGYSMGGAVALLTAAREPAIEALITDCAFAAGSEVVAYGMRRALRMAPTHLIDLADRVAERRYGYRFSAARPIDVVAQIAPRPLWLIHASDDSVVPIEHGYALYAAAGEPKHLWICEGVDHCGAYFLERELYVQRVTAFFDEHLAGGA